MMSQESFMQTVHLFALINIKNKKMIRLVPSNMLKPSCIFLLKVPLQVKDPFFISCLLCARLGCSLQPFGHLL